MEEKLFHAPRTPALGIGSSDQLPHVVLQLGLLKLDTVQPVGPRVSGRMPERLQVHRASRCWSRKNLLAQIGALPQAGSHRNMFSTKLRHPSPAGQHLRGTGDE